MAKDNTSFVAQRLWAFVDPVFFQGSRERLAAVEK